jgi:hypothetical protein
MTQDQTPQQPAPRPQAPAPPLPPPSTTHVFIKKGAGSGSEERRTS